MKKLFSLMLIPSLLACSNVQEPNTNIVKIGNVSVDTSLTAEQNLQRVDSIYKSTNPDPEDYLNPSIENSVSQYTSNELRISSATEIHSETKHVQQIESLFYFSKTRDSAKEDVIVINYLSSPMTFFIDQIDSNSSKGLVTMTSFKVHRRKIIMNGYNLEKYIIVVQSANDKIVSVQVGMVAGDKIYSYM